MLVLERKRDESVDIYHGNRLVMTVTVTRVAGSKKVKLGFKGPKEYVVLRKDIKKEFKQGEQDGSETDNR